MTRPLFIYLSGGIRKGTDDHNKLCWSEEHRQQLKILLPDVELAFFDPALRECDVSDEQAVFGRDMLQVYSSDVVLVDGRAKRGVGVGAEMLLAKQHGIPLVSIVPEESHYRRTQLTYFDQTIDNWIHPFFYGLSDAVVSSLEQAAAWVNDHVLTQGSPVKDADSYMTAMRYYLQTQFTTDTPMKELGERYPQLMERFPLVKT